MKPRGSVQQTAMASEVLITISKDEMERARLMSEWKYVVDTQSKVVQAKQEGRREGQQEKTVEIARNFKKLGIPVEQIIQGTGLSVEDIAKL
jgi:predicted transposase/invertase (TIGR01784 family)